MKSRNKKIWKPKEQFQYWVMVIPSVVLVFAFHTLAWPGIFGAFQDYMPSKGYFGSEWIGLKNFKIFFKQPDAARIIRNTVFISVTFIVLLHTLSIFFALALNEIRSRKIKKLVQTATYLPHFISWVIFSSVLKRILGNDGLINDIIESFGGESIMFLGIPSIFPGIVIGAGLLKEFGFNSILYLTALVNIDPGLYEAAEMDGASRWQQAIYISLPGMSSIIGLQALMNAGNILSVNFDQVFTMYNALVMSTGDVLDTWIYRQGLVEMNYGVSMAVGLLKSVIALFITAFAYRIAEKRYGYKIF